MTDGHYTPPIAHDDIALSPCQLLTVVICTRDRGAAVLAPIQSVLAAADEHLTVIVIDQSRTDCTKSAIERVADPRVRYIRSRTIGLSRSRNIGLRAATTDLVAFTDDDCEVPRHWLERMAHLMSVHPCTAVAFCNVVAGKKEGADGFIPEFIRTGTYTQTNIRQKGHNAGIGAGMITRRRTLLRLGGFDELLGAGAPFGASEDHDIAIRALLAGYHVIETDSTFVTHHGFRASSEGRALAKRNWLGIGAVCAKTVKLSYPSVAMLPIREFWYASTDCLKHSIRSRRPRNVTPILWLIRGFVWGMRTPIDTATHHFRTNKPCCRS